MISDSYFEIGNTHIVCQDYALNGCSPDNKLHYAIVSDGCSSSKHSEIGSQILCHVAQSYILAYSNIIEEIGQDVYKKLLQNSIYKRANELRILYNLDHTCLDATLMIAIMKDNDCINNTWIICWGDGLIIYNWMDRIEIMDIRYESNAPLYLSYLRNDRFQTYKEKFGDSKIIRTIHTIKNDNIESKSEEFNFLYQPCFHIQQYSPNVNNDLLKSVIIGSDGLTSYQNEESKDICTNDIAKDLLGYKRITGKFMKSNILFMNKRYKKMNNTHYDDMSVGIVLRSK